MGIKLSATPRRTCPPCSTIAIELWLSVWTYSSLPPAETLRVLATAVSASWFGPVYSKPCGIWTTIR
jgi:hypothetical protein